MVPLADKLFRMMNPLEKASTLCPFIETGGERGHSILVLLNLCCRLNWTVTYDVFLRSTMNIKFDITGVTISMLL